ncbi:unnamed protein product [Owenia fusiformis]|uniref:Uncharacterized protein n=1 Tax=Owenia fusiformis TaxID=6347 RepID=A0A8J1UWW4_OWEFU|nr:unnamed protein product [Owenia fusiformis]
MLDPEMNVPQTDCSYTADQPILVPQNTMMSLETMDKNHSFLGSMEDMLKEINTGVTEGTKQMEQTIDKYKPEKKKKKNEKAKKMKIVLPEDNNGISDAESHLPGIDNEEFETQMAAKKYEMDLMWAENQRWRKEMETRRREALKRMIQLKRQKGERMLTTLNHFTNGEFDDDSKQEIKNIRELSDIDKA